jgi:hypothetical protein
MATTQAERGSLGSEDGLAAGDLCFIDGLNLYVATSVTDTTSGWEAIAGFATGGWYALGGRNTADSSNRTVFMMNAVTFRAALDATPSSVTLSADSNYNWATTPSVQKLDRYGFQYSGSSSSVVANSTAWHRGTYSVTY